MTVHFIGAGPGAPDLITVRGRDLIARCPVCLYAGSIVPKELLDHCPPGARIVDTAPLSLDEIEVEFIAQTLQLVHGPAHPDLFSPTTRIALARLHDQSLRLGRVVSDLADLSAADAARLTLRPEPVDLAALARAAADEHEAQLRAAGLTLVRELADAVPVNADPGRLHQVIGNLLQNCTRHCGDGDIVTIAAACRRDGTARLTVTDTGPGIPPTDLAQVFTRFWRSGTSSGSGLGMPIVKSLVEAHGGTVTVTSDGHHGTQVTVELPAQVTGPASGTSRHIRPGV